MIYIFDVDNTLYNGSTVRKFLLPAFCRKIIPLSIILSLPYYFFLFKFRKPGRSITEKKIRGLKGISENAMSELAEELFATKFKKNLNPLILKEVRKAKERSESVILATSSFRTIIEPLADYLGADDIIASEIEFNNGTGTGRLRSLPPYKEGKKERVMAYLSSVGQKEENIVFYTDHQDDLPLLSVAGKPVVVNPTRKMRRIAEKHKWDLLEDSIKKKGI
ncbi:MAG: HAD-IB family hydrolase [Candidatus Marinimicrobia bacterium]|nr:HAD-IB family hydrolase [Candidatus Neomarinimicrobiota bacterium]